MNPIQYISDTTTHQGTFVQGDDIRIISVPQQYRQQLYDTLATNRPKGIWLAQTILYTQVALSEITRRLVDVFGNSFEKVQRTVGNLMVEEKLEELDEHVVAARAEDIARGLIERYGESAMLRRRQLGEGIFSDAVMMEASSKHWREFISDRSSKLIDERENPVTRIAEFLFVFKGRKFLVSNCGTGKVVILPVGDVSTCEQAQAWLAGDTVAGFPLPKFIARGRS